MVWAYQEVSKGGYAVERLVCERALRLMNPFVEEELKYTRLALYSSRAE